MNETSNKLKQYFVTGKIYKRGKNITVTKPIIASSFSEAAKAIEKDRNFTIESISLDRPKEVLIL